jgi:uncharacterized membrane protein
MMDVQERRDESELHPMVSAVLRYGVMLAAAVILLGLALSLAQVGLGVFVSMPPIRDPEASTDLTSLRAVFQELLPPVPEAVMDAGVLLLIATPALTVGASAIAFAIQGDWLYVQIAGLVFALLILGFTLGGSYAIRGG